MTGYEYRTVALPRSHKKAPRRRGAAEKIAAILETVINETAAEGWEYLRAEEVASQERPHLLSARTTVHHTILVFRREVAAAPARRREEEFSAPEIVLDD